MEASLGEFFFFGRGVLLGVVVLRIASNSSKAQSKIIKLSPLNSDYTTTIWNSDSASVCVTSLQTTRDKTFPPFAARLTTFKIRSRNFRSNAMKTLCIYFYYMILHRAGNAR
jgi:hypothetical protein